MPLTKQSKKNINKYLKNNHQELLNYYLALKVKWKAYDDYQQQGEEQEEDCPPMPRATLAEFTKHLATKINETDSLFFHWLAGNGYTELMSLLIRAGCWFDEPDTDGNTPLHYAAYNGHNETIDLLIKCDLTSDKHKMPYTDIRNDKGQTPIEVAKKKTIENLLRERQALLWKSRSTKLFQKVSQVSESEMETSFEKLLVSEENEFEEKMESKTIFKQYAGDILIKPDGSYTPDWKDVVCTPTRKPITDPVGYLAGKEGNGSGFLISDSLFLTAGHCVTDEEPKDMTVEFNYTLPNCPPTGYPMIRIEGFKRAYPSVVETYQVEKILETEDNGNQDYAVLRLAGYPGVRYGKLNLSTELPKKESELSIVHHPKGSPKKVSEGILKGYTKDSRWMGYKMDTMVGSSGGPVVHKNEVVAIHTTGSDSKQKDPLLRDYNSGYTVNTLAIDSRALNKLGFFKPKKSTTPPDLKQKTHFKKKPVSPPPVWKKK